MMQSLLFCEIWESKVRNNLIHSNNIYNICNYVIQGRKGGNKIQNELVPKSFPGNNANWWRKTSIISIAGSSSIPCQDY